MWQHAVKVNIKPTLQTSCTFSQDEKSCRKRKNMPSNNQLYPTKTQLCQTAI